ncbi:DR2241 family protein [Halobellus captivus]|uniref:DR2241 family protein n=1 Tax=Halobellus captivus TaxID=2592614 RepID=UPI00193AD9B2|nr:DR2241 family protein [Halobellus captivus]
MTDVQATAVDVRDEQVDALLKRLGSNDGPIEFDGLSAATDADGYALSTPESGDHRGLSEAEFRAAATEDGVAPYVTNWHYWEETVGHRGRHRRAFLRRAEAADERSVPARYVDLDSGMETEWGEVVVTATLGENGDRRYEIRHADDVGAAEDELDGYDDPLDARQIATDDDRGRYRPLKSAPTLISGWIFENLGGRDAVETLDVLYPASVANWNLEREDELDVTHWRETAERQTGIYDIIEDLPREAVEWVAEACCVDSQCLKRREWQYDEGDDLAADNGAGAFPCREPCSLVVAAARKWTKLEEEETHTYEFELTPSEKEQVEAIVDAVADGRIDEIREADVYEGANRYRTRFLRAKRFDEDGSLSGTPTDPTDEN